MANNRARYRWLKSQLRWHEVRRDYYASPIIQIPLYRNRFGWHNSQICHYERELMGMLKRKSKN